LTEEKVGRIEGIEVKTKWKTDSTQTLRERSKIWTGKCKEDTRCLWYRQGTTLEVKDSEG